MGDSQETLLLQIKEQGELVRKLKAAKESSAKEKRTNLEYDLEELDRYLLNYSYICGYLPSQSDVDVLKALGNNVDLQRFSNVRRWWYHMRSFRDYEMTLFPVTHPPNGIKIKGNKTISDQVCG